MILFRTLAIILLMTLGGLVLLYLGGDAVKNPFQGPAAEEQRKRVRLIGLSLFPVGLGLMFYFTCFWDESWWKTELEARTTASHWLLLASLVLAVVGGALILFLRQVGICIVISCGVLLAQVLTLTLLDASTLAMVLCLGNLGAMIALYFLWNAWAREVPTVQEEPPQFGLMMTVAATVLGGALIGAANIVLLDDTNVSDPVALELRRHPQTSEALVELSARSELLARSMQSSLVLAGLLLGGGAIVLFKFTRVPVVRETPAAVPPPASTGEE